MNPWVGSSPGAGNGSPLWNFCLEHSTDRGVWAATVSAVARSRTQPSDFHLFHFRSISFSSKDVNFNSFFSSEVTLNYLNLEGSKNLIGI